MNGMQWLQTAADGTIASLLKGDFGACVLFMFRKISLALVFFFLLYSWAPSSQTSRSRMTSCTSYDVFLRNVLRFGGYAETDTYLRGQVPRNPSFGA